MSSTQTGGSTQPRRCGAVVRDDGSTRWRVWAPRAERVELVLVDGTGRQSFAMQPEEHGYFHLVRKDVPEGQQYAYRLDGGPERPDPCSLWQPGDVHGPSAVVRPVSFRWTDQAWRGVAREDLVIYELHVGTFTTAGTFEAIIPRLDSLRQLGVTALELMPIAQFPGSRNWGYDGVGLYAAQNSYGGPAGLQRLIDACHAAGLALFLDMVYNHLGPEGNYLNEFGPYFTDRYHTPWGTAVNYDGPGSDAVRGFVLDSAGMWLDEFHVDGLRLDAIHAIYDFGARHILQDIHETVAEVGRRQKRRVHVIAESDLNDPRLLWPPERGGYGLDAQWADDFHHAVHVYLTGEHQGYYEDFGPRADLARVLETPFLYAGNYSQHRGRRHGAPPEALSGDRFVVALQNHDQVGNRARGDRLNSLLDNPAQQRLATSLLLLSPYLPLLFMGEEYGEERPFPFFCSFQNAQLVQAVREGRTREFARFAWQGEVPDPQAEDTFASACLSWSWPEGSTRAALRQLHADLLAARRQWPALRDFENRAARLTPNAETGPVLELVRGDSRTESTLHAFFNLDAQAQPLRESRQRGYTLLFSSESQRYGGSRQGNDAIGQLLPHECVVFGPSSWPRAASL